MERGSPEWNDRTADSLGRGAVSVRVQVQFARVRMMHKCTSVRGRQRSCHGTEVCCAQWRLRPWSGNRSAVERAGRSAVTLCNPGQSEPD